jgi:hypothetical protein
MQDYLPKINSHSWKYIPYEKIYKVADAISSLKVAAGCSVKLWEHAHFSGKNLQLPPVPVGGNKFRGEEYRVHDLRNDDFKFDNTISSLEVTCDEKELCYHKPSVPDSGGYDCRETCNAESGLMSGNTQCTRAMARYCSERLEDSKDCREFCTNPFNQCDDALVKKFCESNTDHDQCRCINGHPKGKEEIEMDTDNGGTYNDNGVQEGRGAYRCWSHLCRNGVAPKTGQLHLSQEWVAPCTAITRCKIDMTDAQINMFDDAQIEIINDCQSGRYDDTDRQRGIAAREAAAREAAAREAADSAKEEEQWIEGIDNVMIIGFLCLVVILIVLKKKKKKR